MLPEEAHYAAKRKFGNVTRVKEDTREVWSFVWLEQPVEDIRFGLRMLRNSPGFTAVAVLTLALGIGANTYIFSMVDALLLHPLEFSNADRIVALWERSPAEQADSLVAVAMKRLAEMFAAERARLEGQWDRGDNVSTEDLRLALQRYRSFFGRILSV
jgi:hypothetical protein